ncbi:hypothetical protein INT47_009539 [Mucor saturninus]|uniref:Uncharacterized protein n=1 Tax=Mucor saturninus TaxID=64648 RepID=A0A8H7R635_9FUNG|nr:hypothetical protein INT47_009539 [Mucor saturninus]
MVISEVRHYDHEKSNRNHLLLPTAATTTTQKPHSKNDSCPPSYLEVLAEKFQQQQQQQQQQCTTWDKKADTRLVMNSFNYCCQKLEHLEQKLISISEIYSDTTFDNILSQSDQAYQKDANDSLTRMNHSLEKLIQEAEMSLNTRPHAYMKKNRTCPNFTTKSESADKIRQTQQRQQKKRYLQSQWKLAIAMKQFVETVQNTTDNKIQTIQHNHIHHHYHHHYHHYENTTSIQEEAFMITQEEEPVKKMTRSSSSLQSLFKYALHTVGIIPQVEKPVVVTTHLSQPTKFRTMFLATLLILKKFNKSPIWIQRGKMISTQWKSKHRQWSLWTKRSRLLFFVLYLLAVRINTKL